MIHTNRFSIRQFCKELILIFTFLILNRTAFTQTDQRESVVKRLNEISAAYKSANHLSFDVRYRYSSEKKPAVYLDSLTGSFKLNGNNYWYALDNSEFLGNDSTNLAIFNEDKIIYVNGSAVSQSANPLAMIDSVLLNNQYSSSSLADTAGMQKITIDFVPGMQFKKVQYLIDGKSGFITRMTAVIESDQMYDPAIQPMFNKKESYGILVVDFGNYKTGSFNDQTFSTDKYYNRVGQNYLASAAYANYQIVSGSNKP